MDFICPYKCSYRTSSGYCGSTGGWESCQYRQLHQPNTVVGYVPPLKKTNADRIRSAGTEIEMVDIILKLVKKIPEGENKRRTLYQLLMKEADDG